MQKKSSFWTKIVVITFFVVSLRPIQAANAENEQLPHAGEALFNAIVKGDTQEVVNLIQVDKIHPDTPFDDVEPLFHLAALLPNQEAATKLTCVLIANRVCVNAMDKNNQTIFEKLKDKTTRCDLTVKSRKARFKAIMEYTNRLNKWVFDRDVADAEVDAAAKRRDVLNGVVPKLDKIRHFSSIKPEHTGWKITVRDNPRKSANAPVLATYTRDDFFPPLHQE